MHQAAEIMTYKAEDDRKKQFTVVKGMIHVLTVEGKNTRSVVGTNLRDLTIAQMVGFLGNQLKLTNLSRLFEALI